MAKYVCTVCGYVYEGDELPEDFECPLCGVGADQFVEPIFKPLMPEEITSEAAE